LAQGFGSGQTSAAQCLKIMSGGHGLKIDLVCGNVPVVSMDSDSPFDQHCSWMIQTAADSESKADKCYEYCDDEKIEKACHRLGFSSHDIVVASVLGHPSVIAVGASGKRSVMMACVVAMSMRDPEGLDDLWKDLRFYKIHKLYWEVLELVKANTTQFSSSHSDTSSKSNVKRKFEHDDVGPPKDKKHYKTYDHDHDIRGGSTAANSDKWSSKLEGREAHASDKWNRDKLDSSAGGDKWSSKANSCDTADDDQVKQFISEWYI